VTEGHGGNIRKLADKSGKPAREILDFSANINPLGPPEWLRAVISRALDDVVHYPDPESEALVQAIAEKHDAGTEGIVAGNGSSEIFSVLPRVLSATRALIPVPSYSEYAGSARQAGLEIREVVLSESDGFAVDLVELGAAIEGNDLVYLGQPNNPTGRPIDPDELRSLARGHPTATFIVDEAFADFVTSIDSLVRDRPDNVVVLRSMTKFFAIPGLRLGYAVAGPSLAAALRQLLAPWSVNSLAQAVGEAALRDEDYATRTNEVVAEEREWLSESLQNIGELHVYPSVANFLLLRIDRNDIDAPELAERVLKHGIAVRVCDNFGGLDKRFFRVAVRTRKENEQLSDALSDSLGRARPVRKRKVPALMFQGTSSNAGKSVLCAALCRILLQDGYDVAPFKAQNMSLNSFVTRDGGEMGRAQVMQAQACRLEPDVRMNPVLLKPCTDTGAQVIVLGQPVGNMEASGYGGYKAEVQKEVCRAYDSLAAEHEVIVLEGAGSPGEVNLKHNDIVNMRMAQHADAPVVIVGDIDRGGVYASFVGTMEVLSGWERDLVAGFVANRFRGDQSLLTSAHDYVARHSGRRVLGVVPFLRDLGLPEEDSVEFKSGALDDVEPRDDAVEVAVVDLPHISNFTDFDAFRLEPDVKLRIIRSADELDCPDVLILPGSKNVIGDLKYLNETGLTEKLSRLAKVGKTEIVGLCAGLQMLGREILDPHQIESLAGEASSLGLLPASTTLAREKTLVRADAMHAVSGLSVRGYEIHHGQTETGSSVPLFETQDGRVVGVSSPDGMVWGTYLHGVFDADEFRRWFIDRLRERRGLTPIGRVVATYDLEPAFDRLADVVRESLDLDALYRLMGLK